MTKPLHVMVDLETLGTHQNAVVTQISAVPFTEDEIFIDKAFNVYLNVDEQQKVGRTISGSTVAWWLNQHVEAREILSNGLRNPAPVENALHDFHNWPSLIGYTWSQVHGIWAKGPSFDLAIVDHLAEQFDMRSPFLGKFRQYRDVRTLEPYVSAYGIGKAHENTPAGYVGYAHDALFDCVKQIKDVQAAWYEIGQ